jgi:hypothetical protein
LKQHGPFIVVVVELPDADDIRMVGKLLGDPMQQLTIGPSVAGVFEHHSEGDPAFIARMESDLDDVIVGSSRASGFSRRAFFIVPAAGRHIANDLPATQYCAASMTMRPVAWISP